MKIKDICCIGAGYVGGPTMAVIALKCPEINITVVDIDSKKIKAWNGDFDNLPVYEPGLSEIIQKVRNKNLFFSDKVEEAIDKAQMIFMAVNTPTKTKGEGKGMAADLKYVESSAKMIAKVSNTDKIVVEKSTLPVRTAERIKEILESHNKKVNFDIISNPEFLAEGTAIQDLFKSDRVLIGGDLSTKKGKKAVNALVNIYLKWIPKKRILTTNVWSSELAKLASNAMLAQRISSINSFSAICEKTGANIKDLSVAIGMDHRIGPKFLNASPGFGGSCFQKDILNLVYLSRYYGLYEVADYWYNVVKINNYQRERFSAQIIDNFEPYKSNNKVAILGWAFKEETNDSRESSSIYITKRLIESGLRVNVFDPLIKRTKIFNDLEDLTGEKVDTKCLKVSDNIKSVIKNASSIVIINQNNAFKKINWVKIIDNSDHKVKIHDGRNMLNELIKDYRFYFTI